MTENKRMSISGLLDVLDTGISLSTSHIEYAIQCNILEDLSGCLKELEQYRAIGTVEELKALKENKTFFPIATFTINKKDLQKIVDEKVKEIELDIQLIRTKAIDEFKDAIKTELNRFGVVNLDTCVLYDFMDRKAERMKEGVENGNK